MFTVSAKRDLLLGDYMPQYLNTSNIRFRKPLAFPYVRRATRCQPTFPYLLSPTPPLPPIPFSTSITTTTSTLHARQSILKVGHVSLTQLSQPTHSILSPAHSLHKRRQCRLHCVIAVPISVGLVWSLLLMTLSIPLLAITVAAVIATHGPTRFLMRKRAIRLDAAAFVAFVPTLVRCLNAVLV